MIRPQRFGEKLNYLAQRLTNLPRRSRALQDFVEIGPGLGSLTEVLAARASRVVAVELDGDLAGRLRTRMPANVEVVEADARDVEPESLLNGCTDYKLLGNLPYYAAMPILRHFLEGECKPLMAAVLVQLEVAREICAAPGQMSLLSVSVQLPAIT